MGYIAANSDLINAFSSDIANLEINGLNHYIVSGIYENRNTTFDVESYINNNNLNEQFKDDLDAAKRHYISNFSLDI